MREWILALEKVNLARKKEFSLVDKVYCPIKGLDGEAVCKMSIKLLKKVVKGYWLIIWLSFSSWLGIVFVAKNGGLYLPEIAVQIMQLVLLMCAHSKAKLNTEDLGLTSVNFHMVKLVWTMFLPWGYWCVLLAEKSISQESKAIA